MTEQSRWYRLVGLVLVLGCGGSPDSAAEAGGAEEADATEAVVSSPAPQETFWASLQTLCGTSFEGRVVESEPPDPSFDDQRLVMQVRECDPDEIRIPFHVGVDRSRTWVITRTEAGLRLKHDHRHEDGTEDEVTQYGGDTRGAGTDGRQDFHADAFTADLVPTAASNVWSVEVEPGRAFAYALRREGSERRFRAEFDLSQPIETPPPPWGVSDRAAVSSFLYVWAGAENENDSDFLAVIDADPVSDQYGQIVASVPVGLRGGAHHSEHVMPAGGTLFVNSFQAGATFLIDLSDPIQPELAGAFRNIGEYTYPHSFERLPNGNVLATFQTKGDGNRVAGGLVELDPAGTLVRAVDAADPADPELRAYSVTPIPNIDRAVSTTSDMWSENVGTSFQVWRLSDLQLLKTIPLPEGPLGYEHRDPAEVRLLADSTTAIMTTFTCAMYLLHDLDSEEPWAELTATRPWETYDTDECGIPATRGRFWLQTYANAGGSSLISLDISDPSSPTVLDELALTEPWWPHWISLEPGGDRVVMTSGDGTTRFRVLVVWLDPETGALTLDTTFRDPGSDQVGVSFDRSEWPHGEAGSAKPHGAVFSRVRQ